MFRLAAVFCVLLTFAVAAAQPAVTAGTVIQASHFQTARDRIAQLRTARGLPEVTWTDPTLVPAQTIVRALHMAELRSGLNEAYVHDGLPPPFPSPSVNSGALITASDLNALRAAIDALEEMTACAVVPTFEDGLAPIVEVHVSPGGSDSTGDGSAANPFASIEAAAAVASPGTAIRIHEGTYPGGEFITDLAGTAEAPIWIGGAPGEARPALLGAGEGLHLVRGRWIIVHDLEVSGSAQNGINADDGGEVADPFASHHLIFRDLFIHDVGGAGNQDCLKLSGLNDFFVLDSEMADCGGGGSGSAIDQVGCHHGLIARNHLHDLSANAVQVKGGSEDIEIRWNRIVDGGERALNMGGSTGFEFFRPPLSSTATNAEARDIRAIANIIEGATAAIAFVGCVDCLAANNTIVDPTRWILRVLQETTSSMGYTFEPASDGRWIGNLVYYADEALSTHVNIGPDTDPESFVFSHNLWYAHDNPGASAPVLPVPETSAVIGMNPAFTTGYEIGSASPAAGAGTAITGLGGDFAGRCYASPPSIGAYEAP